MRADILHRVMYYVSALALCFSFLMIFWLATPVSYFKPASAAIKTHEPLVYKKTVFSGNPIRVIVPSLGIDLPVESGYYNASDRSWTLANHKAFYATPTPPVNSDRGNTLIYGHNNRTAFRTLTNIKPGAELIIKTDNGFVYRYQYARSYELKPSDTGILSYDGPPIVTLQTCSGNWNELRKMFTFEFDRLRRIGADV